MASNAISKVGVPVGTSALLPQLRAEILAVYPFAKRNPDPKILDEDGLIECFADCDAAIVGLEPVSKRVVAVLSGLRVIGKFGVGIETTDFRALPRHGVLFGHQYGGNRLSVAELTIGFAIAALCGVSFGNAAMRAGGGPHANVGSLLTGRVFGTRGCGHAGIGVVRLLQPYYCEVIAHDIADNSAFYRANGVEAVLSWGLLARSEALSLHISLTQKRRNLYDGGVLEVLRRNCVLIHISCSSLESGRLQAVCVDVFAIESAIDDRLLRNPTFLGALQNRRVRDRGAYRDSTQRNCQLNAERGRRSGAVRVDDRAVSR